MARTTNVLIAIGVIFAAGTALADPIDPNNPPEGRFFDDWGEVFLAGKKIGYAHSTNARKGDQILTSSTMVMKLGRVDQPISIEVISSTTETIRGKPLAFGSTMKMAAMNTSTSGVIRDGKVTVTTAQFGMKQSKSHDFPEGALMVWGAFRLSLLKGFKPGTKYEFQTYAPELKADGAIPTTVTIGDWEEIEANGKHIKAQKVTASLATPVLVLEMVSWVDQDAHPLRAHVPMPGMGELSIVATDQATALSGFVPPELFLKSLVEVGRPIDRNKAQRIRYRITAKNDDVDLATLPTTGMQTVASPAERSVELTVTRQPHQPTDRSKTPVATPDLSEFLDANLMINTADPELMKLAKRASGPATEPFALADRLRRFVTDYVETKNLNIGFATASEVCRNREGDCSEHGVLLAALGRINGLPSRVVVGLAYVPSLAGRTHVFGYHMWTQFYIDHRWIDFDAALRESDCSPARIAFATSSLKDTGLADISLPLLSKIGGIHIEILEVDSGTAAGK